MLSCPWCCSTAGELIEASARLLTQRLVLGDVVLGLEITQRGFGKRPELPIDYSCLEPQVVQSCLSPRYIERQLLRKLQSPLVHLRGAIWTLVRAARLGGLLPQLWRGRESKHRLLPRQGHALAQDAVAVGGTLYLSGANGNLVRRIGKGESARGFEQKHELNLRSVDDHRVVLTGLQLDGDGFGGDAHFVTHPQTAGFIVAFSHGSVVGMIPEHIEVEHTQLAEERQQSVALLDYVLSDHDLRHHTRCIVVNAHSSRVVTDSATDGEKVV